MNYVDGQNREQLFVTSLDQLVHPESFVRIIDAFVDSLDFSQFNFSNTELNAEGRPPFHPEVLLKLYLYGLHYGIRSFRKLDRAVQVDVEVMWLLKKRKPHYETIANFRTDNAGAFRVDFSHFVLI